METTTTLIRFIAYNKAGQRIAISMFTENVWKNFKVKKYLQGKLTFSL